MTSPVASPSEQRFDTLEDVAFVPLPETRRTTKSRRDLRRRRRRRRRNLRVSALLAVAGLLVLAVLGRIVSDVASDGDGEGAGRDKGAAAAPPPARLVVQRDAAGQAVSLFLLAPHRSGKGGSLVLIPPGAMAEAASLDLQPLGNVLTLGGPLRLQATVQNLLGIEVASVHVFDADALGALVSPAGTLTVAIPERVEQVDERGTVHVLFEQGEAQVAPGDVPRLLAERGRGSDLARLARHQAFWEAWLARLDADTALPREPAELRAVLAELAAGDVRTRVLPVTPLGAGADGHLYRVDRAELVQLQQALAPEADTAVSDRPRVQILNGTGEVQLGQRVADKLGTAVEVKLTGNAARFDYTETQVVFYDKAEQPKAERVRQALGLGRLVFSRNPLDVVDVTIIVGKDFK